MIGAGGEVDQLGVSWSYACTLRGDRSVWCWGQDFYGQIGDGTIGGDVTLHDLHWAA